MGGVKKNHLIVGRKPLLEKLTSIPEDVERIYIQKNATGSDIKEIISIAKIEKIPFYLVPQEKLYTFTRINHQGVVAFSTNIRFYSIQDIIDQIYSKGEIPLFAILDTITDVRNVGTIARTAWASGFHTVVIPPKGMPPIQEDAIKVSAGALELIPLCRENLEQVIKILKLNGIKVYSSTMDANQAIQHINFKEPCAVIMGSEQEGIHPTLLKQSDANFKIPILRGFDSFNVSVSFGMIAYEVMLQRQ
ncbi:MAG: TrmH family RNA methyltransferase [Chitinophagaceae bacterium]